MDTNMSLKQGSKFNQYQTRIKTSIEKKEGFFKKVKQIKEGVEGIVEGFTNVLETAAQNLQNANNQNAQDSLALGHLGRQFNVLAQRQQTLESSAETSVGQALARYGSQNPYKGQNIRLDEANAVGYVTNLGDFKWYAPDIVANTAGKNGCPAIPEGNNWTNNPMNVTGSITGSNKYNIPGSILGTNPTLIAGTPMISGQSCGNEGSNVYVNQMVTDSSSNYIGCYRDFAEGDTNEADRAMIWNSNEIGYTTFDNCKLYAQDHGYKYFGMQDVQSNGIAACLVSNDLTNSVKYGEAMNVVNKVLWASGTNGSGVLMQLGAGQINLFQNGISIFTIGQAWDPACSGDAMMTCQYFLVLQDDGNMVIYKGTPSSIEGGAVWASGTSGQQQTPNPNWVASKGQTGTNYISFLGSLMPGQWIGSNDGSSMLIMQGDGNLVLYTSTVTSGCSAQPYGEAGGSAVNAIYELSGVGDPSLLGKVGYVDGDAVLKEYPGSMLTMSNEYDIYPGMDTMGNDLGAVNVDNIDACKTTCNNIPDCAAFVWETGANICFPKNSDAYPKGSRQANSGLTLGVRRPSVINDSSCPTGLSDIDTVQYANYVKGGNMDSTTSCSVKLIPDKTQSQLNAVDNKISQVAGQMGNNLNSLYSDNATLNSKMVSGEKQLQKNIQMYSRVNNKINSELGNQNVKESMLNMQDLNAMISDTDLVVLQNNYQYMLWSIIALGSVIITVNALKK